MNTIQQAHILLVDDNTDLLRLLEEQLRGTPMPTACSGWDWAQTIT